MWLTNGPDQRRKCQALRPGNGLCFQSSNRLLLAPDMRDPMTPCMIDVCLVLGKCGCDDVIASFSATKTELCWQDARLEMTLLIAEMLSWYKKVSKEVTKFWYAKNSDGNMSFRHAEQRGMIAIRLSKCCFQILQDLLFGTHQVGILK